MLKKISQRNIFLIDALGALTSALLLSQVLARFESLFGMPRNILYLLAAIAASFAVYSFFNYKMIRTNYAPFLKGIAWANIVYCLVTLSLVIYLLDSLTWLGIAYFVGEIFLVMFLASLEIKMSKNTVNPMS